MTSMTSHPTRSRRGFSGLLSLALLTLGPLALAPVILAPVAARGADPTQAADDDQDPNRRVVTTQVWIGDLNIATAQGEAMMHHRLVHAARAVCGLYNGDTNPLSRMFNDCYGEAMADVLPRAAALVRHARAQVIIRSASAATPPLEVAAAR